MPEQQKILGLGRAQFFRASGFSGYQVSGIGPNGPKPDRARAFSFGFGLSFCKGNYEERVHNTLQNQNFLPKMKEKGSDAHF